MSHQFTFGNRWVALGFAAFIMLGVYALVGTEDDASILGMMQGGPDRQAGIEAQVAMVEPSSEPEVYVEHTPVEFADDADPTGEDLIDSATGTDPSPADGGGGGDFGDGDSGSPEYAYSDPYPEDGASFDE